MSGIEFAFGAIGAADVCFSKSLIRTYKTIQIADTEFEENTTAVEAIWTRISTQLEVLKSIWDSLDDEYKELQDRVIPVLARKLESATIQLSKVDKKYNRKGESIRNLGSRTKYVLAVNSNLRQAIDDLKAWQEIFDPTWYFTTTKLSDLTINCERAKGSAESSTLSTSAKISATLRENAEHRGVFLPEDRLATVHRYRIPFSNAQIAYDLSTQLPSCILDRVDCAPDANISTLTNNVRTLASRLRHVKAAEFHLLSCHGVVKVRENHGQRVNSFELVFHTPKGLTAPKSLREHLGFFFPSYSLTEKLRLAKQLAISVICVHTLGFVHKNIRPETVLIFSDNKSKLSLYLVGFKTFRMADGRTLRMGDADLDTNLYRHPDRQWLHPEADYTMQHDIYSLGVCLLEIGLGESFVNYDDNGELSARPVSERFSDLTSARSVKERLVTLAKEQLPIKMGEMYTNVVLNCLTCADADNVDFGDEGQFCDDDGVLIGVRYIEKILLQLNSIAM